MAAIKMAYIYIFTLLHDDDKCAQARFISEP